jgi:hypothetical protein
VFLLLPGTLYLGNLDEFRTAPLPLARLLLGPAVLLMAVALLALRLSRRPEFSRLCSVLAALVLLAWTQAYLLVWNYGVLDGSAIDWGAAPWRALDALLWIGGLAAAAAFHRRLGRPLAAAALALVALQAVVVGAQGVAQRDALALKHSKRLASNDLEAMARFSTARNVLHVVLDSFQADVFQQIVSGPGGDRARAALRGFTFFEEHLGTFPATYLALPVIVSGQVYRNQVPRAEFMEGAYGARSLTAAAHAAGYEVDVATDSWMLDLLTRGHVDHAYLTAQLPVAQEAAKLVDLALFRLAPHLAKRHVYSGQQWLAQRLFRRSTLMRFPYFTHNAFLATVARDFRADRPAPVYKYFHLMTTHAPFVVNEDCTPAGRVVERVREHVLAQSRCSLGFVLALLDRMREAGVYDDSLVVLMSDHGGHLPPLRYRQGSIVDGNMEYDLRPDFVGLATPLLAIKPPGATGAFAVSPALTSMSDVAATIDALAGFGGGLPGTSIWDPAYGASGRRRFYGYEWSRLDPISEYIAMIREHTVAGSAYDVASWRMGPVFLPPEPR